MTSTMQMIFPSPPLPNSSSCNTTLVLEMQMQMRIRMSIFGAVIMIGFDACGAYPHVSTSVLFVMCL
ncbi:hypothetical protein BDP27DRAFT_1432424 [Rhodocollybia butyracea]|uniref:Uncharacterized protein n=1 Tax=Rhodocollybia butyracea TaxID=206335 RepID=A0A9P5P9F0_9AGAR|nr:hypothetical protein BDP27DRAFT_1432424 [Rhodocollybia butyracea]